MYSISIDGTCCNILRIGKSIRFPNRWAHYDLQRHVQVGNHSLYDDGLLGVLPAEICYIGQDDIEEFGADGGDAAKMSGAELSTEGLSELLDVYPSEIFGAVYLPG
jgi:hypothetical protein